MAEILIKYIDHVNPDPTEDREGAYKKGMPIIVVDDGYLWARLESKQEWLAQGNDLADWHGKTIIIKIPGVDKSLIEEFIAEQIEDDVGTPTFEDGRPKVYRRRRWSVDFINLPVPIRNTLDTDGEYTADNAARLNSIKGQMKRIRDGAAYTGLD